MTDLVSRIARRARARRISRTVRVAGAAGLVALVGFLVWVVVASPWLTVRTVEVEGVTGRLAERVVAEAEVELDRPLARVDLDGLTARIESIAQVRSAEVGRVWPRKLSVKVVRREPAAYLPLAADDRDDAGFHVVDREGVVVRTARDRPGGLPRLSAPRTGDDGAPDPDRVQDALAVLGAAPGDLRERALVVRARTPDDVRMELAKGVEIRWGSAADLPRKAEVLAALMGQRARVYDVSAPGLPTTRG